ncbi:MAG: penicillin-binding protein [Oscillospiraceae bacterium]|nr:penicillin-binding protein [Oscillospiraceae bacterium]
MNEEELKSQEETAMTRRRTRAIILFSAALLALFIGVLYNLQVVQGEEYLESSSNKIVQTETVSAARGEILDSLGNVLVTNQVSYQISLDLSLLGEDGERSATLLKLMELCQEYDISWSDSLAISSQSPYEYTSDSPFYSTSTDDEGNETRSLTRLGKLCLSMGWITEEQDPTLVEDPELPTAEELLEAMCESFGLEGGLSEDNRALCGVLYELYLREKSIYYVDYVFAEDVDTQFIAVVKENGLSGVSFDAVTTRQYNTTFAAHLLGRVGAIDSDSLEDYLAAGYSMDETVGISGVEQAFESYLRGISGTKNIETNTSGKTTGESWAVDDETGEELSPQPGGNVVLTLDIDLQEAVENALADVIANLDGAEGGAAVVLDVSNGDVLAMASYPTYDLASFSESWSEIQSNSLNPLYNRALQGTYAPGSTFKMVTAIAGLQEGIITPTTKIQDTGAYTYYTSNISEAPKCWIYRQYGTTHGWLNVTRAIEVSCNVFFYDVGRQVGITKLNEYARLFGLGESTGIELSENVGIVAGPDYTEGVLGETWYEGSTLSAAIGQENNQFTPLQLANYVATLVNGGNHYAVHLLKRVMSSDYSEVLYEQEPELLNTVEMDEENVEAVKQGMLAVAEGSSYYNNLTVSVGAKTGSAQVTASSSTNAVYVAFAPYDDPEIALCIVVEKGGSGSQLAAAAAEIIAYYFGESTTDDTDTTGTGGTDSTAAGTNTGDAEDTNAGTDTGDTNYTGPGTDTGTTDDTGTGTDTGGTDDTGTGTDTGGTADPGAAAATEAAAAVEHAPPI